MLMMMMKNVTRLKKQNEMSNGWLGL